MQTYADTLIKNLMRKHDATKIELFEILKGMNKKILAELKNDSSSGFSGPRIGAYVLTSVLLEHKIFNMSPLLVQKLHNTKIPMNMNFVLNKAWEYYLKERGIKSAIFDFPIVFPINIKDRLAIFTLSGDFIVMYSYYGDNTDVILKFDLLHNPDLTLEEEINNAYTNLKNDYDERESNFVLNNNLTQKQFTRIIKEFFASIVYILCSGQPDLREVNNVTEVNTKKRLRKVLKKGFDQPLVPRIEVGLGFEKERLYTKDKWERMSHLRWQPYGPRDNVQYKLIEIAATEVTRRKKTLTKASANT